MTYRQRKQRLRRRRGGGGRPLALGFGVIGLIAAVALLSGMGYVLAVAGTAPDLSELKPADKGANSEILAADGSRLGYVQSDEIRTPIAWEDQTPDTRQAVVAIEDERFYKHKGVDFGAIVRAGVRNAEEGKNVQGGSTLTQQLVRALYIKDPQRNVQRKIREAKLASELEKKHSKRWILRNYLNDVPFGTVNGRTAIGIEAAAETFFDKHAKQLTLPEAALLAGLPQAPSQYNPFRDPGEALKRRGEVLGKMAENGFITPAQAAEAKRTPIKLKRGTRYTRRREPFFFDYVQEKLIEHYGAAVYRRGGLKVHTTIDPKKQDQARQAINGFYGDPAGPSSAIASVDPKNGEIKAMASSGTYKDRRFNLAAQGHRQPGSAFKVMVLTAAVRSGINPATKTYTSKPLNLNVPGYGPWQVKTFGNTYGGSMNLVQATLKSDNTIYAQLIIDVGPKKVCETAKLLGIETKLDCLPAEGLGGLRLGVTPLEIAGAYATLASGGVRHRPTGIRKVVFPDGKSESFAKPEGKRVLTDGQASVVTKILEQNVQSGTGTKANIGCPAAGKTGTTDSSKDAWFVGYTPNLASSVWVGYPNANIAMPGGQGGTLAAPVWGAYMRAAKGGQCNGFPEPKQGASFSPFNSTSSQTGTNPGGSYGSTPPTPTPSTPYTPPPVGGGNTGAGQGTGGYDPRVYEAPPEPPPPPTQVPAAPAPNAPGGGGDTGGANGNGGGRGGN
ncbi:MAG: transglycosylase domain-containing protein [Thermoleophilaceae bacterium]